MTKRFAFSLVGYFIAAALALLLVPGIAHAAVTIEPSDDQTGATDLKAIQDALKDDGTVTLKSGETYYISGNIYLENYNRINATGATIISSGGVLRNYPTSVNYGSLKNVSIEGGTWKSSIEGGYTSAMVYFCHGENIVLKNMTIEYNYEGRAIELIACKDVDIDGVTALGIGSMEPESLKPAIQIDVAASESAPWVEEQGSKYINGAACEDIAIENCLVRGARGICSNYAFKSKEAENYHKDITISNNTIIGMNAEGVMLFNAADVSVQNNVIVSMGTWTNNVYSTGLRFALTGTTKAESDVAKNATYLVRKNAIMGYECAVLFSSFNDLKFGKVSVEQNELGVVGETKNAIRLADITATTNKSNALYEWDGEFETDITTLDPGFTPQNTSTGENFTVGWFKDSRGWYYRTMKGTYASNQWLKIKSNWYHFDPAGYMQTGWLKLGSSWYYLKDTGAMATGWQKIGNTWYYLNTVSDGSEGVMRTGWVKVDGTWYFMTASGAMQTGWINVRGTWYYFNSSGAMQTGWHKINGAWYYLNTADDGVEGVMRTGWVEVDGTWYYMNASGVMQTGWLYTGGHWYYLNSSGAMIAGKWIGNYYLTDDGRMATNTWIGDYYVGEDGAWDKTKKPEPETPPIDEGDKEEDSDASSDTIQTDDESNALQGASENNVNSQQSESEEGVAPSEEALSVDDALDSEESLGLVA